MSRSDDRQDAHSTIGGDEAELFQRLVSSFPSHLYVAVVREGEIIRRWVGSGISELTEYGVEELEQDPTLWPSIIHHTDKDKVFTAFERLISGVPMVQEYRIFTRNGQLRWIRETCIMSERPEAGLVHVLGVVVDITERKASVEHLIEYKELLDEAPTAVVIRDLTGRMVYCNQECARIYGYESADDMVGTMLDDLLPLELREEFDRNVFAKILAGPWSGEVRLKRKNGSFVEAHIMTNLIRGPDNEPIAIYGILTDITEQKRAEEQLLRLSAAVDSATEGIGLADLHSTPFYINPALYNLFGYTLDDYKQLGISAKFVDKGILLNELIPTVLSGEHWQGEAEMMSKDGRRLIIDLRAAPVFDKQGKMTAIMATHTDITMRKRAERALRESEELLRATQNSIPANMAVVDSNGNIIAVNEAWERFARENGDPTLEHTVVGSNYLEACRNARGPNAEGALEALEGLQAILDGRQDQFEMEYPCPSLAEDRWFLMRAKPLYGGLEGLVTTHINITKRKRSENALRASEALFRQFVENSPAAVAMFDNDLRYLLTSKRWLTDYKLGNRNVIGLSHYEVFPEAIKWNDIHQRCLAGAIERRDEDVFEREDGRVDWLRWEVQPWRNESGDIGGIIMFTEVITDQVRAREELKESEEKYRTLVEDLEAVIFRLDTNGKTIAAAGRSEKITGHQAEQYVEDPMLWSKVMHTDDLETAWQLLKKTAETGQPGSFEARMISLTNETRWMRVYITPRVDSSGNLLHYDGVGVDITDQKEAQLREAQHAAVLAALAEISQAFASSLELKEILEITVGRVSEVLDCLCTVASIEPRTGQLDYVAYHYRDVQKLEQLCPVLHSMELTAATVLENGRAAQMVSANLVDEPGPVGELARIVGLNSALSAPVVSGGEFAYVILCARETGQVGFDEEDLWFVTEIASHASAALTNAMLYRRQSRIAETLQRSLVPERPSLTCLDIATLYAPAVGEAAVGGDFFDIVKFREGQVGLVVGDVSGKGLDAAIHTAETKYMFRMLAYQNPDPGFVMPTLNGALCAYLGDYTFVTLVYILIDVNAHTLTYINAGHELPILLCTATQTIRELGTSGPALGIVRGQNYSPVSASFEPDDLLLCYTDGITEAPSNGDRYGYDRLLESVQTYPVTEPQALLEQVVRSVRSFSGGKQPDDQVVVVVRPR